MPNVRARELDAIFRARGTDGASIEVFTHLIERINDLEASLTVMAQLVDRMSDTMTSFMQVAGNMRDVIEDMKPKQ